MPYLNSSLYYLVCFLTFILLNISISEIQPKIIKILKNQGFSNDNRLFSISNLTNAQNIDFLLWKQPFILLITFISKMSILR